MIECKNPTISIHPTLHGQLQVDWAQEYKNEFSCPRCEDGYLTNYYYRSSKSHKLELRCNSCKKETSLSCVIPGAGKKNMPISIHETLSGKLKINWYLEYKNEFFCPDCKGHLTYHYSKSIKSNLVLNCAPCKKSIYLTCAIPGIGKKHPPISTHETLHGELKVNWYLEYKNEFSCPNCNHDKLIYSFKKDKSCNLVLECSSCNKATHLLCAIRGAGKKHSPISVHKTLNGELVVNWYLEYKNEFSCPECNHDRLRYCYDRTKSAGFVLECPSCNKKTSLAGKVSSHIYNYQSSIECPNPLCTKLGHDGQKGWVYTVGETIDNCCCYFCKVNFDPNSTHHNSWISNQTYSEVLPFDFNDNSWDLIHFLDKVTSKKKIYFSKVLPEWYYVCLKKYIYQLLRHRSHSITLTVNKKIAIEQLGEIIITSGVKAISGISRDNVVDFIDTYKENKPITFNNKLSFLREFFESLGLDDAHLIRQRDYVKKRSHDPEWLDELTRQRINENISKLPPPIACHYLVQQYTAARAGDICQISFDCLIQEDGTWYIKLYQHKTDRHHKIYAVREIVRLIQQQQQWIRQNISSDYPYLFCHFRSIRNEAYPNFENIRPLLRFPAVGVNGNPMVRIVRMLIEKEDIRDANGQRPHFTGKITRPSRLQEVRVKHGMEAAQLLADHNSITTTFQSYAPPSREEVAAVDLPIQAILMNPDSKYLPWQSLPESLLKNSKAHELDLEIAPRLVVYGHCALDPKTLCPHNLYPKCYGCSSFRPSTAKLPLYERQHEGEQLRLIEAEQSGAELAVEEAKATLAAMDIWLPELRRLAND